MAIAATATDRHTTVASEFVSATVAGPCAATTYERTVTNRHDISHSLRMCAHARGKDLRAMGTVATVRDGSRPNTGSIRYFPRR